MLTKGDLPAARAPFVNVETLPEMVTVSAKTGEGLEDLSPRGGGAGFQRYRLCLWRAAHQRPPGPGPPSGPLDSVRRARQALLAGVTPDALLTDVEEALEGPGELTGQSVREDVTARIFQRFCVGK